MTTTSPVKEVRRHFIATDVKLGALTTDPDATLENVATELTTLVNALVSEGATRVTIKWRNHRATGNENRDHGYFGVWGYRP